MRWGVRELLSLRAASASLCVCHPCGAGHLGADGPVNTQVSKHPQFPQRGLKRPLISSDVCVLIPPDKPANHFEKECWGVPWRRSALRVWHRHCGGSSCCRGAGLICGPGSFRCRLCSQQKERRERVAFYIVNPLSFNLTKERWGDRIVSQGRFQRVVS